MFTIIRLTYMYHPCIITFYFFNDENILDLLLATFEQDSTIVTMLYITATAKSLQSRPTLCDPTDGSPPGSAIPGILQARTLEWVAISFPSPMHESEK